MKKLLFLILLTTVVMGTVAAQGSRRHYRLDSGWLSVAADVKRDDLSGFEQAGFRTTGWKAVRVPHNWDQYEGYRRLLHGNRHGYAWYRRYFATPKAAPDKRFFLFFEGVGSYATVWLNGQKVGYHAGGRTTFTIDVTRAMRHDGKPNLLAVRADHPANIRDLPWVDGGCSPERGFSEGSQPMGIFRPVTLVVTGSLRVEPFGVHVWNNRDVSSARAGIHVRTRVRNYGNRTRAFQVIQHLRDHRGKVVFTVKKSVQLAAGEMREIAHEPAVITKPVFWNLENPYLYTLETVLVSGNEKIDVISTPFGIRTVQWPELKGTASKQFYLNGKPVFINGIAEYEHLLGASHAFSDEQVAARVKMIRAAGFNAFRDAHQPHNLRYQKHWDRQGVLSWTQLAAHIWFDSPAFRENFKRLLTEWVIERRNSPSVVLWGLENESTLPADFARECTELIRKLDPTASEQRLVTTCNGGEGTDWDVPQNWTGTYGGNPLLYGEDLKKQVLVGEYGAWRTIDLHAEDKFKKENTNSESYMNWLMETKIRLADSVKNEAAGHYFWLFNSHDNPGRVQGGEGYRELDRIGPVNYKGMLTPWEEPTDSYYLFRANYVSAKTDPMVYLVSHTWPDRWTSPGIKDSITVYSNCDEVELFNGIGTHSFGRREKGKRGTHFTWNKIDLRYNILYALGYRDGKVVARDCLILRYLPEAPDFKNMYDTEKEVVSASPGYQYLYRVNCGGPDYRDHAGQLWLADRPATNGGWGSVSWTSRFEGLPPFFASQRQTADPIAGTRNWPLFQTFRYGREQLQYYFPIRDGEYLVELYFAEPWIGTGGLADGKGLRLFDVAVNGKTVLKNLDLWQEAGHDRALRKVIKVRVQGGRLELSFPGVAAGQAIISAIAIASEKAVRLPADEGKPLITLTDANQGKPASWMNTGDRQFENQTTRLVALPPELYGASWVRLSDSAATLSAQVRLNAAADVWIGFDERLAPAPAAIRGFSETGAVARSNAGMVYRFYKKRLSSDTVIGLGHVAAAQVLIAALPPASLEPAYDLNKVVSYKALDAQPAGQGVQRAQLMGRERMVFGAAQEGMLNWHIYTGVADTYSLTLKYHNPTAKEMSAELSLYGPGGMLLKKEVLALPPSKPGKWSYLQTTTGGMINAGNYSLRLAAKDCAGLAVDALDVQ
ncbi:malectin domain-containing carbohydrate-binding protein [Pedobacter sp. SYP-B3415]|uniref:malectin domain-containing carbohydrate-binding protein n=1 Tax=Pedobacter sp. SYP-B3415 TaxID=2496641 RepID=UPI00101C2611|nr:malectin domain-containing carbohydrate-binding protein [Pedobacter sp. SYP-B3415]